MVYLRPYWPIGPIPGPATGHFTSNAIMNSKADVIAISTERPSYPQDKSRWFGKVKKDRLKVLFSFYSPDGNEIAMPIAAM